MCMCLCIGHANEYYSKARSIVRGHRSTTDSLTACECLGGLLKGLSWRQMFFFGLSLQGAFKTLLTTVVLLCKFEFAACVVRETFSLSLLRERAAALISRLWCWLYSSRRGVLYLSHSVPLFFQVISYLSLHFFYSQNTPQSLYLVPWCLCVYLRVLMSVEFLFIYLFFSLCS